MHSFEERLQMDLVEAMKRRDKEAVGTIRLVKADLENLKIEKGRSADLSQDDITAMLRRLIKQRREAADQYRLGGAYDRAEKELEEAKLIEKYLPEQMTDEEITQRARQVIQAVGATSTPDIGKVMGKLMSEIGGKADGARVKAIVSELLGGK